MNPRYCTHGVLMDLYCWECFECLDEPEPLPTDPRNDFADSVGMPLHEKIR